MIKLHHISICTILLLYILCEYFEFYHITCPNFGAKLLNVKLSQKLKHQRGHLTGPMNKLIYIN